MMLSVKRLEPGGATQEEHRESVWWEQSLVQMLGRWIIRRRSNHSMLRGETALINTAEMCEPPLRLSNGNTKRG